VLRRLLRRAAYQGRTIGLSRPFLAQTAEVVIDLMQETYPELWTRRAAILETLTAEEERFSRTISGGIRLLERALSSLPAGEQLPGSVTFKLYDTYGFPLDLTEKIAVEHGHAVDRAGFAQAMEQQRQRSRAVAQARRGARHRRTCEPG
jgi:alanyl-tRNA synthetase